MRDADGHGADAEYSNISASQALRCKLKLWPQQLSVLFAKC